MYATLSRVSFWGNSFTQYHILFPHCRQPPPPPSKKETPRWRVLYRSPLPLEYQAASSQARLKSCWALPPWYQTVFCSGPGGGGDVPCVPRYLAVVGAAAGALTPRHPRLLRLIRRCGPRDAYQRVSPCIIILYTYCIHSLLFTAYIRV